MAKVYVANLGGHDFSDAQRYGELVYLTTHGFKPKEIDRVTFELLDKLRFFDADRDYFLPVGQDLINLTALWILTQQHETFKVLYWDYKDRQYIAHTYEPALYQRVMKNIKIREELEKDGGFTVRH